MKNPSPTTKTERHKTRTVWIIIAVIVLAIVLFFAVKNFVETPKDLGPQLTYVGKEDYGCLPFPFFFFCDSPRGSNYYYTTNMTIDELSKYFTKANNIRNEHKTPPRVDYEKTELGFRLKSDDQQGFTVEYFNDTRGLPEDFQRTNKNFVKIQGSSYTLAQQAL